MILINLQSEVNYLIHESYELYGLVDKSMIIASFRVFGYSKEDILNCIENSVIRKYIK